MKKLISITLALAMIFAMSATVFAEKGYLADKRIAAIRSNVNNFLSYMQSEKKVVGFTELYNFDNELEAFYYSLDSGGYIVASYKDGHVIEFSPEDLPVTVKNIESASRIYYGGPLSFSIKKGPLYIDIVTGDVFSEKQNQYSIDFAENIEDDSRGITASVTLSAPSSYVYADSTWRCCITGITNLLQYYDDYHGDDVYPSTVSGINGLRYFLYNNNYVYRGNLFLSDAETLHTGGGGSFTGLSDFLNRNDVDNMYVTVQYHTLNRIKTQINYPNSRPVLLMIDTFLIDSGDLYTTHIVLCYGYTDVAATGRTYYVINNGWGTNGVYICSSDVPTSYEMLYLVD